MKIITWNCAGRFADTASFLFAEDPDLAIIQECLKSTINSVTPVGYEALWFGDEQAKGIAVFCKWPLKFRQMAPIKHKWVIPIHVSGPSTFTLIAVWSCPPRASIPAYIKLIREAVRTNDGWFRSGSVVMAGDFNSNSIWDKPGSKNHKNLVEDLAQLGISSAYHSRYPERQAEEPTFLSHWKKADDTREQWKAGKTFHIDYIFAPEEWLSRMHHFEIGDASHWGSLSDHLPLIASFANANG